MPKQNRIFGAQIRAISGARRISGDLFSLSFSPAPDGGVQCACIVSKKVSKLAVERNLIRRRCREALRASLASFPAGVYLFHAKSAALGVSLSDIRADIQKITARIR